MSYYFPLGANSAIEKQNIDYALTATTASVPLSPTITAITTSYAATSEVVPPNGSPGTSITEAVCQAQVANNPGLLISGTKGSQGERGSKGEDRLVCPDGTVRCMSLEPSLSAQFFVGGVRGANYEVSSGSQYSIVCMQIPEGCTPTEAEAGCPDYLYIPTPRPNIP